MLSKAMTAHYYLYWPAPMRVALTLQPRAFSSTTTDSFAANVSCTVCRKGVPDREAMLEANVLATDEVCIWEIWDMGQAAPRPGDVLLDPSSVYWTINKVRTRVYGNLYSCICVKNN